MAASSRKMAMLVTLAAISAAGAAHPAAEPAPVVTEHRMKLEGRTLDYAAEAGRLPVRDIATGEPVGHIFYIYYRLRSAVHARPITFVWNGGPGAPAASLNFEGAGPKRIEGGSIIDNRDTWLTDTDLVFVDPVGSGFSRAVSAEALPAFTSIVGDVAAVTEFIRSWLILHRAQGAPLIIAGQSYGAGRAGSVAHELLKRRIDVRGLALISNTSGLPAYPDQELISNAVHVADYAVTALHYRKLPPDLGTTPAQARAIAESWARSVYLPALRRLDSMSAGERNVLAAELARRIGLEAKDVDPEKLTITQGYFLGHIAGAKPYYLDYRHLEPYRPPPLDAAIAYVRDRLGFNSDLPYLGVEPIESGFAPSGVYPAPVNSSWLHSTVHGATPEQIESAKAEFAKTGKIGMYRFGPRLPGAAEAFAINPNLKILVPHGAYDPLGGCSIDAEHGQHLPPSWSRVITFRCYLSGHAIYRDAPARAELARDMRRLARAAAASPPMPR